MKLLDQIKIALHSLRQNKLRTVLTVIIVMAVSSLMMALLCLGFSFRANLFKISKDTFLENGTYMHFFPREDIPNNTANSSLTNKEIKALIDGLDEYGEYADGLYISTTVPYNALIDFSTEKKSDSEMEKLFADLYEPNVYFMSYYASENVMYTSCVLPMPTEADGLKSGRIWTKEDRGTNGVWLNETFVEKIFNATGKVLKVGDEFSYRTAHYYFLDNSEGNRIKFESHVYKVMGIFDPNKVSAMSKYYYSDAPAIYADVENSLDSDLFSVYYCIIDYKPKNSDYDFNKTYASLKSFSSLINDNPDIQPHNLNPLTMAFSFLYDLSRFKIGIVSNMKIAEVYSGLIIGLLTVLSMIVLLISIGSVVNTIIISVDKNKKFTGMLKAVGLNDKGVSGIISIETCVQIFLGVILGFLCLFFMNSAILFLTEKLITAMFYTLSSGINYTAFTVLPFYVPLACFIMFAFTALVASRGSIARLNRMDVISIMNELN